MAASRFIFGHCHSSQLYQAQQRCCALCGLQEAAFGPTHLMLGWCVRPLGWQLVKATQDGASLAEAAGARTVSAVLALCFEQMLFPPCEPRGAIPGPCGP